MVDLMSRFIESTTQSKRAVVKTLINRANTLPSSEQLRNDEKNKVLNDLKVNGYPSQFIENSNVVAHRSDIPLAAPKGFAVIPYVKGVSERVQRILRKADIKTAFKPLLTLCNIFKKPKDRPTQNQVKGIVYKVRCKSCSFVYVGESKRSWNSRGLEHKPGTRRQNDSAIRHHAESTGHDIHPNEVIILERGISNKRERLFLESLHSTLDSDTVNEKCEFPKSYTPLLRSLRTACKSI